jgi:xanthine dehydrogenase accessory factor
VLRDHRAVVQGFKFSGKDATTMDAICGGQVDVLVEWMDGTDPGLVDLFHSLNAALDAHHKTWLISALPVPGAAPAHTLVHADGALVGVLPAGLMTEKVIETRQPIRVTLEQRDYFIEPLDLAGTAFIFGAGHVSRSLAEFTKAVGFWTVVLDDRDDYACSPRFPTADQIIVLENFTDAFQRVAVDRDSFVVIVTRGHLHDRTVLAQALRTSAGYIGMIGSRHKNGLVFDELRRQGFSDADLKRVSAPIGLAIGAETPEEIGVSIVAEMIQVRAKMKI